MNLIVFLGDDMEVWEFECTTSPGQRTWNFVFRFEANGASR